MYELSKHLIEVLEREGIHYCHWKSNLLLNEALDGYDDLDLLVARDDVSRFEIAIMGLGFKEGSNPNISFSSIKHFYGFDEESGNILHLHVYYQIKTGASWTKSMRFDLEEQLLNNTLRHESGMRVPEKHIEFTLFIIRIMMKYSKVNEYILVEQEKRRTPREIEYLLDSIEGSKLRSFLELYFPEISEEALYGYAEIIKNGSLFRRYTTANILKYRLRRFRNQGMLKEGLHNIGQLVYRVLNRLFFRQKKRLHSAGTLIVVAGLDATGKTTITAALKRWLGKDLTVSMVHFGKPTSALLTLPINAAIRFMRKKSSDRSLRSSIKNKESAGSILYIIRQVVLAYDRHTLMKKVWKKTSGGEIVLCDRYKSEDYGVMDSKRLNPERYGGVKKWLAQLENALYDKMPEPDLLFYLTVPVEIAVMRNEERIKEGKESEAFIRIRHEENRDLNYRAKRLYKVDTAREYERVIQNVKSKIWRVI
ncbi:MAG: hypothetical protein BV458_04630 [Thermoplasmata archaeon M9B2D]|nr:MAG: hypothetical protein BV458_04630 [Thermoplasmata archaeon M9B2D]